MSLWPPLSVSGKGHARPQLCSRCMLPSVFWATLGLTAASTAEAHVWMVAHRSSVTQPAPDTDQTPLLVSCSSVVFTVLFHPKDLMLFSGGEDSDVRVWDLNTKSCVATLKVSPGLHALLQAHLLAFTTKATACESAVRFIVTAGSDLHAQIWHSSGPPVTVPCLNEQHNTVEQVLNTLQLGGCPETALTLPCRAISAP